MGVWNTKINGNDTFQDIYQTFFDLYNYGHTPDEIYKRIQSGHTEIFEDIDERNNAYFGLAMAQWETKSLKQSVYNQVKEIIDAEYDLKVWKQLGADEKTIQQRKKVLEKFLTQISTETEKPKRRTRPKFEFEMINLIYEVAPDKLKYFSVNEEFTNKQYVHTSGIMSWQQGGGSVLYFREQGRFISAKWLNNKTLEITHEKNIPFTQKDESSFFCGDSIKIVYKKHE